MSIQVKGINKQFGAFTALNNINLDINSGEQVKYGQVLLRFVKD